MPFGSLKENRFDSPMCGVPMRENSSRRYVHASVLVPSVERALPPSLRWSMITTGESPSMESTSGREKRGSRLRRNAGYVSFH
jgi:hypothetical protein